MELNTEQEKKTCFVIMPISDVEPYQQGHFRLVYDYIIKPACLNAGFTPIRADEVESTNYIVIDILKRIIEAEIIICDLSSRNPNVLYELGIRQAFNLPVTLIKDSITPRIFDIQGLRDIEYDESLRIDRIESTVNLISQTLINTHKSSEGEVNSLIQLLGVRPAPIPAPVEISKETFIVLDALDEISKRIAVLEDQTKPTNVQVHGDAFIYTSPEDDSDRRFFPGDKVRHRIYGEGRIRTMDNGKMVIDFKGHGPKVFKIGGRISEQLELE
jgi:hypothetical protein